MCVGVCLLIVTCVCVSECTWRPEVDIFCPPLLFSTLCLETGILTKCGTC